MKILICTTRMGIGGAETHVLTLARELKKRGCEPAVASSGGILADELERSGIRHVLLPLDRRDPLSVQRSASGIAEEVRAFRPDVVHAHGRIPAFVCGLLRRRPGFPPVVTTVHGTYGATPGKKLLSYWGDRTLAVSDEIKDYLRGVYGLPADSITVIPNGAEIRGIKRKPHGGFNILMCSRLDKDTVGPVAATLALLPSLNGGGSGVRTHVTVVGDGSCFGDVKKAADACGGCVTLAGPAADISRYYAEADLFIGSSRSLIEALAAGIPSVMLSAVKGGCVCDGFVTEENVSALAGRNFLSRESGGGADLGALLRRAAESFAETGSALPEETVRACLGYVSLHNSIETVTDRTLEFYRETVGLLRGGIVLCGYFGAGNAGDDASLASVLSQIRGFAPDAPVYVTVKSRGTVAETLPDGVIPLKKRNLADIRSAIKGSRLFVLCGGSLLQNATSDRSLYYYCALSRLARKNGCKTVIWGGGIGPLKGKRARASAGGVLEHIDFAGFRDEDSLKLACSLSRNTSAFALTRDPVCDGSFSGTYPGTLPAGAVAVCPREISRFYGKKAEKAFEESLSGLCSELKSRGFTPVFTAMAPADEDICLRLMSRVPGAVFAGNLRYTELEDLLRRCALSVSVRLHGCVFAKKSGIPALCLSYDPKVSAFAERAGFRCVPVFPVPDTPSLISAFEDALGRGPGSAEPEIKDLSRTPTDAGKAAELYLK